MALTEKQKRFVNEYLIDFNATRAYKAAGYSVNSDNAAGVEGHKLLKNPKIREHLTKRIKDREKRTEITQDKVLKELVKIGFADIKDYLSFKTAKTVVGHEDDGTPIIDYATVVDLRDSEEVDGAIISEVQLKDGQLKLKLHDKMKALNDIGKHLGMFIEKVEHSGDININVDIVDDDE